ncbi:Transcription factor iws1 [Leucoagaricus sp. SymC.cos]|nr:Transcription factor iws1 [Leucoagaricus sp. SymC.cos]
MAPQVRDLEREVFGGSDSEFSSDDEDDLQFQRQPVQQPPASPKSPQEQGESSGGDSEDDYVQEKRVIGKAKKRTAGRKKRSPDDSEDRPAQRKRKRKAPVEIDLSELPPEQATKRRLDKQIEDILRTKKPSRPRKKKNNDEVLDSFADDEVARLREAMLHAADEDIRANSEKLPAHAKLRLLPEAMETLRKASLAQSMIDNNLLEGVKRWLEPLPDRSLPALNIQRELFSSIRKMEFIDTSVLKESGLGRIVLFYTKSKRVTPDISRIANELVSTWSRPIIKRSASYRDRVVPVAPTSEEQRPEKLNTILARAREQEKYRVRKNAVQIPMRQLGTYTVAPRSNESLVVVLHVGREKESRAKLPCFLHSLRKGRTSKAKPSTRPQPMNLQRNPSMFGPELPQLPDNAPLSPAPIITSSSRLPHPKVKTLRRVRRLAPARRISFSSLVPPGDEADADGEGDGEEKGGKIELGSAFQLH